MKFLSILFYFTVNLLSCQSYGSHAEDLDDLYVDSSQITLSGFSSGGTFAQQLLFAFPNLFSGIGVFSHSFYRCGPPNGVQQDYDRVCTTLLGTPVDQLYNPDRVHEDIKDYESKGLIGRTNLLKDIKLYVYAGLRNELFTPAMSLNILNVFERYIQNPKAIRTRVQDSPLVMPSNKFGPACSQNVGLENLFVGNCGFSGAYEALRFLLGPRVSIEPTSNRQVRLQNLQEFDQVEFTNNIRHHQMDFKGYFYVPKRCQNHWENNRKCLVHLFFHGCLNGRQFNGTKFVQNSGYLEVAELNDIIMIFPQALSSVPQNEIGCWDTFGISGPLYATNRGAQVLAVKKIIDKLIENGRSTYGRAGSTTKAPNKNSQRTRRGYTG